MRIPCCRCLSSWRPPIFIQDECLHSSSTASTPPNGTGGGRRSLRYTHSILRLASYLCSTLPFINVLVCAAAVCPRGRTQFQHAFQVNARAPALLLTNLLPLLQNAHTSPRVLFVSSGDGELCYFHTQLQHILRTVVHDARICVSWSVNVRDHNPPTHLVLHQKTLLNVADLLQHLTDIIERDTPRCQRMSVVHSDQPAYALSKACLNVLTRIAAHTYTHTVQVVATCPGDVWTPIGPPTATRTPDHAAKLIVQLAHAHHIQAGSFYRDGIIINW